jgi:hypothetical protein
VVVVVVVVSWATAAPDKATNAATAIATFIVFIGSSPDARAYANYV